ncbi:MAG: TIGR03960 family B12-binding radical SAM protein, partial [Clostridia bacterium]|nr:TIGR03960 family B12-binding radical SAM protein [Clostridia bacterium]
FVDLFFIGEGEEVNLEVNDLYRECKNAGKTKKEFLSLAAKIQGVYVPSLYDVSYNEDGTVSAVTAKDGAPEKITKRVVAELDTAYYPDRFPVPLTEIVHDRAVSEIFRGCIRGCRFCQAGFIYRPVREKSVEVISEQCRTLCQNTGYDELSLSSLSTSDYTELEPLLDRLMEWTEKERVSISLPSQRVDSFSTELMEKIKSVRRSGLTFAPEAGTQRLRDTINKNVTEEELIKTCRTAFSGGWTGIKLYFMIGLPTETDEDIVGIADLGQKVVNEYYKNPDKPKGKSVNVTLSASSFVPKPFTPFQWEPQDSVERVVEKQQLLCKSVTTKKITVNWHDAETSFVEAVFARGDRRCGKALLAAWKMGCKFDGWTGYFKYDLWLKAFEQCGLDLKFYASRRRSTDEVLPWDHIDVGISKNFLKRELEKAYHAKTTNHCRQNCSGCGADKLTGGVCHARG